MSKKKSDHLAEVRAKMSGKPLNKSNNTKTPVKKKANFKKSDLEKLTNHVLWDRYIKISIFSEGQTYIFERGFNVSEDASPDMFFETSFNISDITSSAIISIYNLPESVFYSFKPLKSTVSIDAGYLNNAGSPWISNVFRGVIQASSTSYEGASKKFELVANSFTDFMLSKQITYNSQKGATASRILQDLISLDSDLVLINLTVGKDIQFSNGISFNESLKNSLAKVAKESNSVLLFNNLEVGIYPLERLNTGEFQFNNDLLLDFSQTDGEITIKTIFNPYIAAGSTVKLNLIDKSRGTAFQGAHLVENVKNVFTLDKEAYTELKLVKALTKKKVTKNKTGGKRQPDHLAQVRSRMAKGVK